MNKFELQDRFVSYSSELVNLIRKKSDDSTWVYLSDQTMRSAISASLNYSEAMSGESDRDFIHKLGVALKELRESQCCLKLLLRTGLIKSSEKTDWIDSEANELIAILVSSIATKRMNMEKREK